MLNSQLFTHLSQSDSLEGFTLRHFAGESYRHTPAATSTFAAMSSALSSTVSVFTSSYLLYPYAYYVLVVKVMVDADDVLSAVPLDDHADHRVLDHLSHDGVVR